VRHFVLFPTSTSSSTSTSRSTSSFTSSSTSTSRSSVRPATVEVGQRLVLGQGGGRGDGKKGVVDAESRQSPNSHGDSPTTLRVAGSIRPRIITISALTGLTGVGVVPHPPADREDQWRR